MNLLKPQASAMRDGIVINTLLVISPALNRAYQDINHMSELRAQLLAGASSGLIAYLLSQPFHTLKAETQDLTTTNPALIAKQIYNKKGVLGFYSNSLGRGSRLTTALTLLSIFSPLAMTELNKFDRRVNGFFDNIDNKRQQIESEIGKRINS